MDESSKARQALYLAKAAEADASAINTMDPHSKKLWLDAAVSYRALADHLTRTFKL